MTMQFICGVLLLTTLPAPGLAFSPLRSGFGPKYPTANVLTLSVSTAIDVSASTGFENAAIAEGAQEEVVLAFSHVHLYVDQVEDVAVYKQLERDLAVATEAGMHVDGSSDSLDIEKCRKVWNSVASPGNTYTGGEFVPQNRDVVKQLIAGLGFRVTGSSGGLESATRNTRSVLVTSKDPRGVQYVVTSVDDGLSEGLPHDHGHFDATNLSRYFDSHSGRQGIAVLAFEVTAGSIESIRNRYHELHPALLIEGGWREYREGTRILEVCAYYEGDARSSKADEGTLLRFVQRGAGTSENISSILPGFDVVDAEFDLVSQPAYCDHWVSNVFSRTGFIDTLEDTLGFTPKVDFNAGVVAAGEAQIESTVTGNDSKMSTMDKQVALKDQSQVYLPINNALSEVGHVHGFLEEIGQGIQHVASRVEDLPSFVQKCNYYREITGEGFTFLNIPRSYYGVLSELDLAAFVTPTLARFVMDFLEASHCVAADGAVDLDLNKCDLTNIFDTAMPPDLLQEYQRSKDNILEAILQSRYSNLHNLLGDHLSEESYLRIVRNKILVDVQGEDLLFQIFTSNILQRNVGDEAPFFEFIQRVCSECKGANGDPVAMKPGCGGFGIRNFLTLFLSIEVTKAMLEASQAKAEGDEVGRELAQGMVDTLTDQLNESNPILTEISDAMTLEGALKVKVDALLANGDEEGATTLREELEAAGDAKNMGNKKLMNCSTKYMEIMRSLRRQS